MIKRNNGRSGSAAGDFLGFVLVVAGVLAVIYSFAKLLGETGTLGHNINSAVGQIEDARDYVTDWDAMERDQALREMDQCILTLKNIPARHMNGDMYGKGSGK